MEALTQKIEPVYCTKNGRKRYTYIMADLGSGVFKVGKSNDPARRMREHAASWRSSGKSNWRILAVYEADDVPECVLIRWLINGGKTNCRANEWASFAESDGDLPMVTMPIVELLKLICENRADELGYYDEEK